MLRALSIDGYKGLCGVDVPLNDDGITVFLGPNGSGKSSVFGALELLSELATQGTQILERTRDGFHDVVHRGQPDQSIILSARLTDGTTWTPTLGLHGIEAETISGNGQQFVREKTLSIPLSPLSSMGLAPRETLCSFAWDKQVPDDLQPVPWPSWARAVSQSLERIRVARFNPKRIAEPAHPSQEVEADGYGLPVALLQLQNERRKSFNAIDEAFRELFPWVEEVQTPFETEGNETHVKLRFLESGRAKPYEAEQMASGMLIALSLLWVVMRPKPDRILCYEEPENSLHPWLLTHVYELLGKAARGELGASPVRVLVATHSVDFVNLCSPAEIRVCERDADGRVHIHTIDDELQKQDAIERYKGALGELWYSGAIGGVPNKVAESPRSR